MRKQSSVKKRIDGNYLNDLWGVGAAHALYINDGLWYHQLRRFPGALFDRTGYVLFRAEKDYQSCPYLSIGKHVHVRPPGISGIPGYVFCGRKLRYSPRVPLLQDVDIHSSLEKNIEGRAKLVSHLRRERQVSLVRRKKLHAISLQCEICGFSFKSVYGAAAADYCEVHHLVPLASVFEFTKTRMEDLAILCANCHRVVHLQYPPYKLEQVRMMLSKLPVRRRRSKGVRTKC